MIKKLIVINIQYYHLYFSELRTYKQSRNRRIKYTYINNKLTSHKTFLIYKIYTSICLIYINSILVYNIL